jgi:N-acetyl-anhydromuramyl-L-alanine amidase AmpD
MIILKPMQVIAIEPGKLYAWRDLWALSVQYKDSNNKNQVLLISFESAASQASFISALRERGYAVSTGQYPVSGSVWS